MESSTAISVQWGPVEPCSDQNGPITGYSVRYGVMESGELNTADVDGGSVMTTTLSNLAPSTAYSIEVAAVNDGGTGVYSEPLIEETLPSKWINNMKGIIRNLSQVYTSVKMVTSSPTMDMWISMTSTIPFSVTLTSLHLLVVLILEETGLHQMGLECLVLMSQELPETEILW